MKMNMNQLITSLEGISRRLTNGSIPIKMNGEDIDITEATLESEDGNYWVDIKTEPPMTEFEQALADLVGWGVSQATIFPQKDIKEYVREHSERILNIAFSQVKEDTKREIEKQVDSAYGVAFHHGFMKAQSAAENFFKDTFIWSKQTMEDYEFEMNNVLLREWGGNEEVS